MAIVLRKPVPREVQTILIGPLWGASTSEDVRMDGHFAHRIFGIDFFDFINAAGVTVAASERERGEGKQKAV